MRISNPHSRLAVQVLTYYLASYTSAAPFESSTLDPFDDRQDTWPKEAGYLAPYNIPEGDRDGLENNHMVFLRKGHSIDSHIDSISLDLRRECESFAATPYGYRAQCPEPVFHDHVRHDPGVMFVEHDVYMTQKPDSENDNTSPEQRLEKRDLGRKHDLPGDPLGRTQSLPDPPLRSMTGKDSHEKPDGTITPQESRKDSPEKTGTKESSKRRKFGKDRFRTQKYAPWHLVALSEKPRTEKRLPVSYGDYKYSNAGEGIDAYIVDTGIDITHKEFEGRASHFSSMIDREVKQETGKLQTRYCQKDSPNRMIQDVYGHVAGVLGSKTYGVAKQVNLLNAKWYCDRKADLNDLVTLFYDVLNAHNEKADNPSKYPEFTGSVINLSIASGVVSHSMRFMMPRLREAGILTTYAVSNHYEKSEEAFCDLVGVICVTSYNMYYEAAKAAIGRQVDYAAPSDGITALLSKFAPETLFDQHSSTPFGDGTSLAAPIVAGLVAQITSEYSLKRDAAKVEAKLKKFSYENVLRKKQRGFGGLYAPKMAHNSIGRVSCSSKFNCFAGA